MKTKIAINGFGRIGRNAFKVAFERPDLEVVAVNDLTDTKTLAHLLRHDSNYGTYQHEVEADEKNLIVEGQKIKVLAEKEPANLPWKDLGVDIVIESTGLFTEAEKAKAHIDAGAKKVIISAPVKGDGAGTVVIGVNEDKLGQSGDIISNASCTTNCIAPVAAIIESNFGIEKAMMTTVHSYTASQRLQDAPAKDLREARNAATNIVPTTTGASIAAAKALPALEGVFGGLSVRVPTPVVSLSDFAIVTKREVTIDEVNEAFKKAAADPYFQGIVTVTEEELVSSDYIGNSHSAIVDLKLTNVIGGNLLKVVAWYDNEWGYSNRLIELTADLAKLMDSGRGSKADNESKKDKTEEKDPESAKADKTDQSPITVKKDDESGKEYKTEVMGGPESMNFSGESSKLAPKDSNKQDSSKPAVETKPYTITEPPAAGKPDKKEELLEAPKEAHEKLLPAPAEPSENSDKTSGPEKSIEVHEPEALEENPDKDDKGSKFHHF